MIAIHGLVNSFLPEQGRRDYLERIVRGGFPEAVRRTPRRRSAFFSNYLDTLIERDIKEISDVARITELRRLLGLLAGRAGNLVKPATLAGIVGVAAQTVRHHVDLLTEVFLVKEIPAWSSGQTRRTIGTPKLGFVDSGLACHLLNEDAKWLADPRGSAGPMMENFVLMELARQLTWSETRAQLFHYRTKDQIEVDAILEGPHGLIVGIEVKASGTVRDEDLRGLRHLEQRLGDRLHVGLLLYTGEHTLSFGGKIRALPIDALWQLKP